jgi:hypothetical protein
VPAYGSHEAFEIDGGVGVASPRAKAVARGIAAVQLAKLVIARILTSGTKTRLEYPDDAKGLGEARIKQKTVMKRK